MFRGARGALSGPGLRGRIQGAPAVASKKGEGHTGAEGHQNLIKPGESKTVASVDGHTQSLITNSEKARLHFTASSGGES